MNSNGGILPPSDENGKSSSDKAKKKKSFVRISHSTRAKESRKKDKKEVQPAPVVEAEVVDDDEEDRESFEENDRDLDFDEDVIDVDEVSDLSDDAHGIVPVKSTNVLPLGSTDEGVDEFDDAEISEQKGLVVTSALQRYLEELRKYSLLSAEEEREVATRAYEQNDIDARNRLVTANLRLVVKIAMEYRRAYSQILDLIQEGNAGLVQAVNRFNPYRGVKLSTYSAWWIRAYILKFLMDNKSLVRMGTTEAQRKLFFRLRSEAERMYALTQRFDARLLAENIGVKESDVVEMQQRLSKNDVSLDAPVGEDGETRQVDTLVSNIEDPDEKVEREQIVTLLRKHVAEVEKELNDRDAFIFRNRILADDPITLQDVGNKFGITRERARQLEARVLKKIKDKLIEAGIV